MKRTEATNGEIRDKAVYSARNSSKGALVAEAGRVFSALASRSRMAEVRDMALEGRLLSQRSRNTRKRIWVLLHYRYFAQDSQWVVSALKAACEIGSRSHEFVSLLYLHYALRDRLTYDFVTKVLWEKGCECGASVSRNELLDFLDSSSKEQPQIRRWSENSRVKLAGSILTALRDFRVLYGTQKKTLVRPPLPLSTVEHLLRILTVEGCRGREVLEEPTWRLFMLTEEDVAGNLLKLSQHGEIHFEKAGRTVVLQTPTEWENSR